MYRAEPFVVVLLYGTTPNGETNEWLTPGAAIRFFPNSLSCFWLAQHRIENPTNGWLRERLFVSFQIRCSASSTDVFVLPEAAQRMPGARLKTCKRPLCLTIDLT